MCHDPRAFWSEMSDARRFFVRTRFLFIIVVLLEFGCVEDLRAEECIFVDDKNVIRSVDKRRLVPSKYRKIATCRAIKLDDVSAPSSLDVGPKARTVSFGTTIGTMNIRWARELERCYSTSPSKAVGEASRAVSRALRASRLLSQITQKHRVWDIVLTDKTHAIRQVPRSIIVGKHPGFMLPPNKVYIVSDFISPACIEKPIQDELLLQVLLHEMGHVIEYILLGEPATMNNRERGEGFATWFESYSSGFSKAVDETRVRSALLRLRLHAEAGDSEDSFNGSAMDYARAAMPFFLVVSKKGTGGIARLYQEIRQNQTSSHQAIRKIFGWSPNAYRKQLESFTERFLAELD